MKRRRFLQSASCVAAMGFTSALLRDPAITAQGSQNDKTRLLKPTPPPALKAGMKIGIPAPAGGVSKEVLRSRLTPLNIPIIGNFPIGHIQERLTMPIGVLCEVDADNRRFSLLEPSVMI